MREENWIPACAGMTARLLIYCYGNRIRRGNWRSASDDGRCASRKTSRHVLSRTRSDCSSNPHHQIKKTGARPVCFIRLRCRDSPTCCGPRFGLHAKPFESRREPNSWLADRRQNKKPLAGLFILAERAGFEPAVGYEPTHAFQACDLNRSSTSPASHA